ncbi:response regulator transcription factor [Ferroacidibacillus organovorans]|uniref:DNA-binding response regulator n=1 Tax=Ferroacidibacillus organovorans TaxID=1765683 RepID=A0A117SYE7_9BACL|nr:response regulator transcription factor [Ferroacidibacillus organovorans]KUO96816.1 hypothetical protein ATW55_08375 [Ferroacidibacillus organovorans]
MPKILLVEDDVELANAVISLLDEEGFDADWVQDGDEALHAARSGAYDVALMDVMIPSRDGLSVVARLRKDGERLPVMMLTARDSLSDRVRGLETGADDYLVKPFAGTELIARLRALLRRVGGQEWDDPDLLTYGPLSFSVSARELTIEHTGEFVVLPPKEAVLLEMFLRHPNRILTRSQLMDRVWGFEGDVLENTLESYVSRLRKRLENEGCPTIQTIRGLGYRLQKLP